MPSWQGRAKPVWTVSPEPETPVIANVRIPGQESLYTFFPHDPKRRAPKKIKTEEEKRKEFQKYWIKPAADIQEEDELEEELMKDAPIALLEDVGLQKAVPMSVKEIQQLDTPQKKNWFDATLKEYNSLTGQNTFE